MKKSFQIGNIIREEIINSSVDFKNSELNKIKILVLGGSQAAKIFAEVLPPIFEKFKNSKNQLKFINNVNENQNDELSKFYQKANIDFEIFNFTDNILNIILK